MLKINDKTFMNLQEAVQWLLDNNALPFQSTANYVANTEIGLGTIVNPTPAKVRIGSLIFFADSKVSTVIGVSENGFMVSDQYNDLVDDVVYVSNVELKANGHLMVTLSNGDEIDAGLIKQVSGFSINASQHLIASFNDGTSTDLGAIFQGNINIAGNFTADSIIENMSGYSFNNNPSSTISLDYVGVVKTGNKVTFAQAGALTSTSIPAGSTQYLGEFIIPTAIGQKLFKIGTSSEIDFRKVFLYKDGDISNSVEVVGGFTKNTNNSFYMFLLPTSTIPAGTYYFRYEATFLLSDNMAS